ncbi:MAG: sugar phosphate isomerase/epimerase [Chloroflexota bacterium]
MKLGFSTWGMPKIPIDTALSHLAALGYDGVEITVIPGFTTELSTLDRAERSRIAGLLQQHNLDLPAIAGHRSLMAMDADEHQENMSRLKGTVDLAVDWAEDLGMDVPPSIDTTTGGSPDTWDETKSLLVERTHELVDYAASKGVTIAMEPHVGAAIDTPDRVLELLQLVDSPYLKINFDISHFNIQGISIDESVSAIAPHTIHTHVKDERGQVPDFEFLIPGEGEFDYVYYLKAMQAAGYTDYISAEISFMVQKRPEYDALAAATQTYATLAAAFEIAGIVRG